MTSDTPRARALTRIMPVNTPSLYIFIHSRRRDDDELILLDGDIRLTVIILTSLLSARHRPALTMGGGGGSGHRKQRSSCLGPPCHPAASIPEESLSGQSDPRSDGHTR